MGRLASALPNFVFLLVLAACSGGDSPTAANNGNNNGGNPNTGGDTGPKADPSFATDIMEILNRRSCTSSGCHADGQGGLTMTTASVTYTNLVNVASPNSGETRVIPGNSADSYLVKKLEGRQSVGEQMPFGMSPLNATDLQNIKNWIDKGAKNN